MYKIVFVNLLDLENMYIGSRQMGQLSLCNIIEEKSDWKAEIWDANYLYANGILKLYKDNNKNYLFMAKDILKAIPQCISIYTMCNNYYQACSLARKIKEINPEVLIVFAGPQASSVARETLEQFDFVDFVALGEGEGTIINILDKMKKPSDMLLINDGILGLAYRNKKGEIIETWNNNNPFDLEKLQPLRYELIDQSIYDGKAVMDMEIGRGCPFSCTYCSTSLFWERNFRVKSVKKVIEEIEHYIGKYGVSMFAFHHDLLTANKKYIMELSNSIIEHTIKIKWACYSRLDVIDDEMLNKMAEAGCHQIYYGIETGSPRMQSIINKNLKLDKIYSVMNSMFQTKINAEFSFILGYPEENDNDLLETINYIQKIKEYEKKLGGDFVRIHIFQIMFFPQTKMTTENIDELIYNPFSIEDNKYGNRIKVLDYELSWIKNNKNIFINYYNLPKNINEKACYLNVFLMMIFNYAYKYCLNKLHEILCIYDDNIYKLYEFLYLNKHDDLIDLLVYIYFDHKSEEMVIVDKIMNILENSYAR